jgi:hypothetical protein
MASTDRRIAEQIAPPRRLRLLMVIPQGLKLQTTTSLLIPAPRGF